MILLVEDEPLERKLVHDVLTSSGYLVRVAKAADQALAEIERECPELILIDMSLPDMDGLALVRQLKADEATREIPIVGVTSFPERYTRPEVMSAGCAAFVAKPLSTRDLPHILRDILAAGASRNPA